MLRNSSADSELNITQMVDHSAIDSISTGLKRRREELEIIKLEKEIKAQDIERITDLLNRYKQTCTDSTLDEQARVLFKSAYMKILIECQNSTNTVQGVGEGGADNTTTTTTTTSTQKLNKKAAAATTRNLDKTTTTTEKKVEEEKKVRNLDRKTAFSLKNLVEEMDLKIISVLVPVICKTVCTWFREMCPGSETFSKKRRTFFYKDDKKCIEKIMQDEYVKYMLRKVDDDFEQIP
jgi:hypothetical protein